MSLTLLLDEDSQAKYLVRLLQLAAHDVLTVNQAGIAGRADITVLDQARQLNRTLLTRNCHDFQVLHQKNPDHAGIIAIYQDTDPSKNMSYEAIVHAIRNFEVSGLALRNQFIVLNQWQY